MKYTCPWCGIYTTNLKSNLKRHMNRKRKCVPQQEAQKSSDIHPTLVHTTTTTHSSEQEKEGIRCQYCNKTFTRVNNKNRHESMYCRNAKNDKKIQELEERINQLQTVQVINNFNTYNNSIHINAFGMENMRHLKDTILYCLKQNTYTESMVKLTQLTYNDPNHPENHTILLKNDRTKFAKISDGQGKMRDHSRKDVVVFVIDKNKNEFDQCIKEHPTLEFTHYGLNHVRTKTPKEEKEIFNAVECALINKSMPEKEEMKEIEENQNIIQFLRNCSKRHNG